MSHAERRALARFVGTTSALVALLAAAVVVPDSLSKSLDTLQTARSVGAMATLSTLGRVVLLVAVVVVPVALAAAFALNREGPALGSVSLLSGVALVLFGVVTAGVATSSQSGDVGPGGPSWVSPWLIVAFLGGGAGLAFAGRHYLRHAPAILRTA
ncbi:MAG: hypothetical protein ABEJ68_08970 [Halobacteriaceae archaeon]